ncbi:MAG TPA: MarR family winged helix-turn-helix transcriptional regulator [Ktedonobacteraceae bacterium]
MHEPDRPGPDVTPPLSPEERELWEAVKTLGEQALLLVEQALEAAVGLSGADFAVVLSRLEDLGNGQMSQRQLATLLGWHRSRLSHQLTRMEARHLLRRVGTSMGPGVILEILPQGREVIAAARPIHATAVREGILAHLGADERLALLSLVRRWRSRE